MPDNTKLTEVITRCHRGLDDLFLLHQEEILLGHFSRAAQLLNYFRELHRVHMDFENDRLIPKLEEFDSAGQWPASLYKDEHTKVEDLLARTEDNLLILGQSRSEGSELRRETIELLDWEKTFKGLCKHHQEREETALLPDLDRQTDTGWRVSVIDPFIEEWNSCMRRHDDRYRR